MVKTKGLTGRGLKNSDGTLKRRKRLSGHEIQTEIDTVWETGQDLFRTSLGCNMAKPPEFQYQIHSWWPRNEKIIMKGPPSLCLDRNGSRWCKNTHEPGNQSVIN